MENMSKNIRKTSTTSGAILILLSLLVYSHVLCFLLSSGALAHSHHHHHHHQQHHQHDHSNSNLANAAAAARNRSSHRSTSTNFPWKVPGSSRGNGDGGTRNHAGGPCRYKRCGAKKECKVNESSGQAECGCITDCKRERKSNKPAVCGTDGRLYPSYCDLRRTACLTGAHIFFSHYQHQHHHDQLYQDRYQRQTDFSFGNGSESYISHKQRNIIPANSGNQEPECFPFTQPHHHHDRQQQHHHHNHHHDPDKNPLRDKNQGFLQPPSPLPPSTTVHRKTARDDEIHSTEYDDDEEDHDDDDDDEYNYYQYSPSTVSIATAATTATLGENREDGPKKPRKNMEGSNYPDIEDIYNDDNSNEYQGGMEGDGRGTGESRNGLDDLQRKLHHPSHHHKFTVDYPIDTTTGSQKGRKISSRTTNGQVDSRHISGHGHSAVPSTYFKDPTQDAWGMKRKTRESEEEFGWRQEENEMSDQAFLQKSKEMLESFGPSAVTNLAWKSLHSKINKDGESNSVGQHWDDPDRRSSSFPNLSHPPNLHDKSKGLAIPTITPTVSTTTGTAKPTVCSPQDYEILKGELFQYDMAKLMNHIKLMTSVSNEAAADVGRYPREVGRGGDAPSWSDNMMMARSNASPSPPSSLFNMESDGPESDKDTLLQRHFFVLDQNHDNILEYIELYKGELENRLELRSPEKTGCQFRDFLLFDDTDHDGQLHVNEFFASFSHFYDITMISLDKALETKHTRAVEGDTVVLRCDITGSPPPYIHWRRYEVDLSQMASLGMKSSIDGTLSLTNVHMTHAGHFSCQSPRNPEVVQTHILSVETQPYVLVSPKASWKRPGEDLLLICRLVLPVIDSSSEKEIATGFSDEVINWTWLFNGIPLRELPRSDNNNKYIFENSSSPTTRMSRLRIREIYFPDMGSYSCQAENSAGIGSDTASLVIIDPNSKAEMQALHNTNARQLLVFHQNGLASYSAEHCGWLWEIFGDDILQYSREKDMAPAVCDQFHSFCDWGEAVQVSPNYVYAAQPSLDRILLIDAGAVQSVGNVLGTIPTCRNPSRMEFVPYTDQLWIRCEENEGQTLFSVVENASKGDHQKAIQFPLQQRDDAGGPVRIRDIYLPSHQDGKRGKKDCQFAYVSFSDEQSDQSLKRVDLKTFTYHKNSYLNLTKFSCIPHQIHFSVSCTMSIINCLDPLTKVPNGQVILDTLSNSVRFKTSEISGNSIASSDNRILLTEKHIGNNTHLFVQRIGAYEIHLLSHFLLANKLSTARVVHSSLTDAYASVAKLSSGKEVVLSLETGEIQRVDEANVKVPHSSRASALYPADNTFPLKTEKSVIVMDADTLRPRCKFYEEIPELHSFLTVQT